MPYKSTNIFTLYTITCLVNDKIYIGVADVYERRVNQHKYLLKSSKHRNRFLQNDFDLYGMDNFVFDVVGEFGNKLEAYKMEKYYTDFVFCMNQDVAYNIKNGGNPYFKFGTKSKRSQEYIEKNRISNTGKVHSAETRKKRSDSLRGRVFNEEARRKLQIAACKNSKEVIDVATNKVYNSLTEAWNGYRDIKYATLFSWMNNPNRNKTSLQWLH